MQFLTRSSSKQATVWTILSALTSVMQTAEVAAAICQKEEAVEKRLSLKNDFFVKRWF